MKNSIPIIITMLSLLSIHTNAQDSIVIQSVDIYDSPYKSFKSFDNDTIAYLEYNFIKKKPCSYAGLTVKEFTDLLPLPIKAIIANQFIFGEGGGKYRGFGIHLLHNRKIPLENDAFLEISIILENPISRVEYDKCRKEDGDFECLKDQIIQSAGITIRSSLSLYFFNNYKKFLHQQDAKTQSKDSVTVKERMNVE